MLRVVYTCDGCGAIIEEDYFTSVGGSHACEKCPVRVKDALTHRPETGSPEDYRAEFLKAGLEAAALRTELSALRAAPASDAIALEKARTLVEALRKNLLDGLNREREQRKDLERVLQMLGKKARARHSAEIAEIERSLFGGGEE